MVLSYCDVFCWLIPACVYMYISVVLRVGYMLSSKVYCTAWGDLDGFYRESGFLGYLIVDYIGHKYQLRSSIEMNSSRTFIHDIISTVTIHSIVSNSCMVSTPLDSDSSRKAGSCGFKRSGQLEDEHMHTRRSEKKLARMHNACIRCRINRVCLGLPRVKQSTEDIGSFGQ